MLHSQMDSYLWDKEWELLRNQEHLEKVWKIMKPIVERYIDGYLEGISHYLDKPSSAESYAAFLNELIKKNDKLHDKYHELFDIELMEEEYCEDVEGFKSVILKKECDVVRGALQSKTEALNEWKRKFYGAKSQQLYDTFYNMMDFAVTYDKNMTEEILEQLDDIQECGLDEMEEDACYKSGVLGHGIVSNILNHMYPRVFPGNYKAGIYSLLFLSGAKEIKEPLGLHTIKDLKGIDMPSETSEFCMVKDEHNSETKPMEIEHNYYYPYETYAIYTIRIYRMIKAEIENRFGMYYPSEFRFLITNDFYEYVTVENKENIDTLTGNDDMLKYRTIW